MSYSRWSNSVWYTFWTSMSEDTQFKLPTKRLKNNQVFEICDLQNYYVSYRELDELGVDVVVDQVKKFYSDELQWFKTEEKYKKTVTEEEFEELKGYLLAFIDDVDDHFKWKNFFKYEWYYPFRNKIIFWYRDKFKK